MAKKTEFSWKTLEFPYYEKGIKWYAGMAILAAVLMIYAIWKHDWLMLLTFIALFIAAYAYADKKPRTITVTVSGKGLTLDRAIYHFKSLKSFWIIYQPPITKTLNFETTNYFNRDISIHLEDQDPNEIRNFLQEFIPEDLEREESYSEQILRRLKF